MAHAEIVRPKLSKLLGGTDPPPQVQNPDNFTVDGNCDLDIWCNSNAGWSQRVTFTITQTPSGGGAPVPTTYIFSGNGEGIPMTLSGGGTHIFLDPDPANAARNVTVLCEYAVASGWRRSTVFRGPPIIKQKEGQPLPRSKHWTILSEDGADTDKNDAMLEIYAQDFVPV